MDDIHRIEKEFEAFDGEYPGDEIKNWESLSMIRKRVKKVLKKYSNHSAVLVVCHEKVIRSMTGRVGVANCEIAEL